MAGLPDLTTEAGVWEHVRPILNKWTQRRTLTEEDAYTLLNCFEDLVTPSSRPVPVPAGLRAESIARTGTRSRGSLSTLALLLNQHYHVQKDLRTLRRWCEQGIIPGAQKTKHGGHWRVDWVRWSPKQHRELAERIGGHARMPRNLMRSRRWKDFERKMKPVWAEYIPLLIELDAELRGSGPVDIQKQRQPEPTDAALRKLVTVFQRGHHAAMRQLRFRLEARRLVLSGKKLTIAALASRVGISRRTMFRRYGKQAKNALSAAANPLRQEDRPVGISETIHEQVVRYFEDRQKIPGRPTPHR